MRVPALFDVPFVALALGATLLASTSDASLSGAVRCAAEKAKAAGRAMVCFAKEQNVALTGVRDADPARCTSKLARAFERAEGRGACALAGDIASAQNTLLAAADAVFELAGGTTAMTSDEIDCARVTNRIISRYASCRGKEWARTLAGDPPPPGAYGAANDPCYSKMGGRLSRSFRNGCPLPDSADDLVLAEGPGAAYLPAADFSNREMTIASLPGGVAYGVDFSGSTLESADLRSANVAGAGFRGADLYAADFTDADATGADFAGASMSHVKFGGSTAAGANFSTPFMNDSPFVAANLADATFAVDTMGALDFRSAVLAGATFDIGLLTRSDLTGADFEGVTVTVDTWDDVTCPDGTNSDDNGNTCCGHHVGNAPASCGP